MSEVAALAQEAVTHWGGTKAPPRLVTDRENAVFDVMLLDGQRAALRLHRQGYQSTAFITSELRWSEALKRDHAFPCPGALRTTSGELTAILSNGRIASMVQWIDAAPIGANAAAFDGPFKRQLALYEDLGNLIRRLHNASDLVDQTAITRPSWNAEALLGEAPHWGAFWLNPALTQNEQQVLQQARENAAQQLSNNSDLDVGLIHADLLQENVLQNAAGLHIIDFDDSGTGYRLYDLGTALIQHAEHPRLAELTAALCTGYGCKTDLMPLFIMLRATASCGWIISRAAADDPRQRFYAERALACAQRYLSFHV